MDETQAADLGMLLRHLRRAAGLTQEALAEEAQVSARCIRDIERGAPRQPRKSTLQLLAAALDLSSQEQATFMAAACQQPPVPLAGSPACRCQCHPLPIPPTALIDRDHELSVVCGLLRRENVRQLKHRGPALPSQAREMAAIRDASGGGPARGEATTAREADGARKDSAPVASFGEDAAVIYDLSNPRTDALATIAFLEAQARGGPALELAIGTGRVALPLAARGIRVDGIDLAPAMIARLRARPGGDQLAVTLGNFADVPVPGAFRLIYVVRNTLFNLLNQDDQVRCFENVAAHLTEDGVFVIEAVVPTFLTRLRDDQYVDAEAIEVNLARLDVGRHDPAKQLFYESNVYLSDAGVRVYPSVTRYAWPSELDLMARIAGLRLRERWAGWDRQPFTGAGGSHVSVYGR